MPNSNTIAAMPPCAPNLNLTAESAFLLATTGSAVRAFMSMPSWVSDNYLDGHELALRASIYVITGGAITFAPSIRLYSGSNTGVGTFTNDTAIITPTPPTLSTVTRLMSIEARLTWDVNTARLNGRYCFQVDNAAPATYTAWATLTAGLTTGVTHASNINWCLTGLFGTSQTANSATLKFFEMDLV